jgi:hypothetical protein
VQPPKTPKPAPARHGKPVSKVEQLGGRLYPSNNPNATRPQAPPLPDDSGESDLEYFTARPHVSTRTRLPFPGEFPLGVIDAERIAFVHVFLASRDPVTNAPGTRARGIFYADNKGGRA